MNSIEFGKKCQPYNIIYRELFGYVPCKEDYVCTRDKFYTALVKAVNNKKDLAEYVKKRVVPEIEVGDVTLRETVICDDGKTYEVERKIKLPVVNSQKK
jgi:hypothetical protein